jgi:peptidoglycan hydrolase-like protein with peptidoglycan-binding domain
MTYKLPSWLDPLQEVTKINQPKWFLDLERPKRDAVFYLWVIDSFQAAAKENGYSLNPEQLIEIAANAAVETGHGQKWNGNNWGGVKVNKKYVDDYKIKNGTSPKWFKSEGHVASGDEDIVYYVYFETPNEYATYWLNKFVPIDYKKEEFDTDSSKKSRYYKTAKAFWERYKEKNSHWFYELCVSGYKGEVTKKTPEPSVDTLFKCKTRVEIMVSQLILLLSPDGNWGPKSKQACLEFQKKMNINPTGELTYETINKLINSYFTLAEYSKALKLKF